jgi:ABC-2 type transport system permease protein
MLWHKAWLESRVRFLVSAVVLSAYCVSFVQRARFDFPPLTEPTLRYSVFVWRGIYNGADTLMFVIVAVMLGLGGLQRERAAGTASYTLALPVSRLRLLATRVAVGWIEIAALASIPVLVVPWMSSHLAGRVYPVSQTLEFALLFAFTGTVWVASGCLWSAVFSGEHTGTVACVLTPVLYAAAINGTRLRQFPGVNILNVMNGTGMPYLDRVTALLIGPLPWTNLVAVACVAAALFGVAAFVTARRDF